MNAKKDIEFRRIVCPNCGKAVPVRILELKGRLRYSLRCSECKHLSEVVIDEIPESQ